jgi:hypothetical protein
MTTVLCSIEVPEALYSRLLEACVLLGTREVGVGGVICLLTFLALEVVFGIQRISNAYK